MTIHAPANEAAATATTETDSTTSDCVAAVSCPSAIGARRTVAQKVTRVVSTVMPTKPSTLTARWNACSRTDHSAGTPTPMNAPATAPAGRNAAAMA